MHILVVDHRDSFVYNVVEILRRLPQLTFEVVAEEELRVEALARYDGLILSPGPGIPSEYPRTREAIRYAVEHALPIFGICLGHQALAEFFGGELVQLPRPLHGHASRFVGIDPEDEVVGTIPEGSTIGRYHSWAVKPSSLPESFVVTGYSRDEGEAEVIMSLRHRTSPIWSVQFHPESMITFGGERYLGGFLEAVGRRALYP